MKKIFLSISLFSNILYGEFKELRTIPISPLSDTIIEIEKNKKKLDSKTIHIQSIKTNYFKTFNQKNSKNQNWKINFNSYGIPKIIYGDRTKKRYYGKDDEIFSEFINDNKELLGVDIKNLKYVT